MKTNLKNNLYKKFSLLLIFLIVIVVSATYIYADKISETQGNISDINAQQSEASKKYQETEEKIKDYESEVSDLDKDISGYESDIASLSGRLGTVTEEVNQLDSDLQNVAASYQATKDLLNTRLRALYENGFVNIWEVLFKSEGVTDFLAKYSVVANLIEYDKKLLSATQNQKTYINSKKQDSELKKVQLEQLQYDVSKSKEALEGAKAAKETKMKELEGSKTELKNMIEQLKKDRATQEAILNAEYAARANSNLVFSGEFTWPAPGVYDVSAMFRDKEYYNWSGSIHKGTDIAKSSGCNIVAAQAGTVITVGYMKNGYGNYIMIDHGNSNGKSYVTLYGHLKSVNVSKGQSVSKGQAIGYMGTTGWSTGVHLHFEIRENNAQINAMNYFPELAGKARYLDHSRWISFPFNNMKAYQI